jgi:hypothetical protein
VYSVKAALKIALKEVVLEAEDISHEIIMGKISEVESEREGRGEVKPLRGGLC